MLLLKTVIGQDIAHRTKRAGRFIALAVMTLSLTACFRPMLAEQPGTTSVTTSLSDIYIDTISGRIGQKLRNQLIYFFSSPNDANTTAYRLSLSASKSITSGLVQLNADVLARTVVINARFTLIENATGEAVHSGATFGRATFEKSNALYANERAELDAENRATDTVAEAIRTQVAAYFATQGR